MAIPTAVVVVAATIFLQSSVSPVSGSTVMHALQERLLGNYSVLVRPVVSEADAVEVNVTVHLMQVLNLVWYDKYLTWKPEDFANITKMVIPQTTVWLPDLVVSNDVSKTSFFGNDRTRVQVEHDGKISWQPDLLTDTYCKVKIYKYPFDQQECGIYIEPWMTTNQQMTVRYSDIKSESANINGEFTLVDAHAVTSKYIPPFSEDYTYGGNFIVVLQRKSKFYLLSMVLPLAAFSLLSPLANLVPADSGEKITLSVTVLLANLVFMGTLADSMPHVGDSVSVFVLYASLQIMLSFMAVIANIIIVSLSHASHRENPQVREDTDEIKAFCCIKSLQRVHPESDSDRARPQAFMTASTEDREMANSSSDRKVPTRNGMKKRVEMVDSEISKQKMDTGRKLESSSVERKMGSGHQSPYNDQKVEQGLSDVQTSGRAVSPALVWLDKFCFSAFFIFSLVANVVVMSILLT